MIAGSPGHTTAMDRMATNGNLRAAFDATACGYSYDEIVAYVEDARRANPGAQNLTGGKLHGLIAAAVMICVEQDRVSRSGEPTGRRDFPDLPNRMKTLPVDKRGYPVPWFVAWENGQPDFRIIGTGRVTTAVNKQLCWICGQPCRIAPVSYVVGPMCIVNRTSAEPPSHLECATFAAINCPFLATPGRPRNERDIKPAEVIEAPGRGLLRNPGVAVVWSTMDPTTPRQAESGNPGWLFNIGDPFRVDMWAEGRPATADEVLASIDTGLPALREVAAQQGGEALNELARQAAAAIDLVKAKATA